MSLTVFSSAAGPSGPSDKSSLFVYRFPLLTYELHARPVLPEAPSPRLSPSRAATNRPAFSPALPLASPVSTPLLLEEDSLQISSPPQATQLDGSALFFAKIGEGLIIWDWSMWPEVQRMWPATVAYRLVVLQSWRLIVGAVTREQGAERVEPADWGLLYMGGATEVTHRAGDGLPWFS